MDNNFSKQTKKFLQTLIVLCDKRPISLSLLRRINEGGPEKQNYPTQMHRFFLKVPYLLYLCSDANAMRQRNL